MYKLILLPACAAILVSACTGNQPPQATSADSAARQCFNAATVNGFHSIDRNTVMVTIGANRNYLLDILGTCPDIDWTQRIGLRSTSGSNWVCQGQDAELLVPGPTGLDRCPVLGVRALSLDEAKALRARSH